MSNSEPSDLLFVGSEIGVWSCSTVALVASADERVVSGRDGKVAV